MSARVLAAMLLALSLAGCGGLMAAGSGLGALGGTLALVGQVNSDVDSVLGTACAAYRQGRAVADAVVATGIVPEADTAKVSAIEQYGDAACAAPPSGSPVSTAIWFGTLVGQLASLTNSKAGG